MLLVNVVLSVAVRNLCTADFHLQALHARHHLIGWFLLHFSTVCEHLLFRRWRRPDHASLVEVPAQALAHRRRMQGLWNRRFGCVVPQRAVYRRNLDRRNLLLSR